MTGPANCMKTTRHHAHLSLCGQSNKTNNAKSKNGQKPQCGQFFDDVDVEYLQIANFSEKQVSFIFSTNFSPKTKKISRPIFEKNIKVSAFELIWRPFRISPNQKSGSVTFLPL